MMNFGLPGYFSITIFESFHHQNVNDNASVANCLLGLMVVFSIVEITILVLFALNSWLPCYFRQTFWWDEDGDYDNLDSISSSSEHHACREDRIRESLQEREWKDPALIDDYSDDDESSTTTATSSSSSSSSSCCHHHQECSICLQNFQPNDIVVSSRIKPTCGHIFHKECLHLWLTNHSTCPCCRREMLIAPIITKKDGSMIDDDIDDESRISIVPWMTETGELPMSFRDYCLFFF